MRRWSISSRSACLFLAAAAAGWFGGVASAQDEPGQPPPAQAQPRGSTAAWTADLPAVSDGLHLWFWAQQQVQDDDEKFHHDLTLYHADATHRPPKGPAWESVTTMRGRLAPHGVAADHGTLWLVFDDGAVSRISLKRGPIEDQWFFDRSTAPSLPPATSVRASVAAHGKLWVLARVETGKAIADLDRDYQADPAAAEETAAEGDNLLNLVLGLPRDLAVTPAEPDADGNPSETSPESQSPDPVDAGEPGESNEPEQNASAPAGDAGAEGENKTSDTPEPSPPPDAAPDAAPDAPAERLLVLDRGRWRVVPLPVAWQDTPRKTQLIAPRDPEAEPALLAEVIEFGSQTRATLFRPRPPADDVDPADAPTPLLAEQPVVLGWSQTPLLLPTRGNLLALHVQQQIVLVQHAPQPEGFAARLLAVRGDQQEQTGRLIQVGRVELGPATDTPANGRWTVIRLGESVGVLAGDRRVDQDVLSFATAEDAPGLAPPGPTLTAVDLRGQVTLAPLTMTVEPEHPIAEKADYIIMLGVVVVSTLLLLSFWRRDPTANQLQLPEPLALADLLRRATAGMIDLAPGLLVATLGFDLPLAEVYARWPGQGMGATGDLMLPGLTAIGIVVAHTALLEIFTGRSLGKFATGLRVTNLTGDQPKAWQVLIRCGLKAFDLVAYLLLVLPVISPYRQRLGDMVARTVVVMKATPQDQDDQQQKGEHK